MTTTPDDVLRFWLGAPGEDPLARAEQWWTKSDAFDAEVRKRFSPALDEADSGALAAWKTSPDGRLALVILTDQLSRNMFRGTARMFATDGLALETASKALEAGDDKVHHPVHASFLLMPFMHAEDRALQARCVAGFETLHAEADDEHRAYFANQLDYARRHAAIIERFGRFPHRNLTLGRISTDEETEFLKEPGSSF
jgi:uncharacterized protein (DUF924 family)